MVFSLAWCREVSLSRHRTPVLEVSTETSSFTVGFFTSKLRHFVHFSPKGSLTSVETFPLCSWRNGKGHNGLLKAVKGFCNHPQGWTFVGNFSSFLATIPALGRRCRFPPTAPNLWFPVCQHTGRGMLPSLSPQGRYKTQSLAQSCTPYPQGVLAVLKPTMSSPELLHWLSWSYSSFTGMWISISKLLIFLSIFAYKYKDWILVQSP